MKKTFILALLSCLALFANAQGKKGVLYLTTPADYQVISISQNGLWACGTYTTDGETVYGFRWNLSTGKIDLLEQGTSAFTVSNNGVVAGSFFSNDVLDSGASIEVPGVYDGSWSMLELPNELGAWATAITPDGHYVTGTDENYVSYIWKNGQIEHTANVLGIVPEANGTFLSYAITDDGSKIGGWAYYSDDNRNPGYWDTADKQFHELNPGVPGSPWQQVRKFSHDGKSLLYWGGYVVDPEHEDLGYGIKAIYDMTTKKSTLIYPNIDDPFNFDLFDMGDKGSVVGYIATPEGLEYGIIYADGKTQYIEDYLTAKGVDFSGLNMYPADNGRHMIARAMTLSADEKTFGLVYYDKSGEMKSLVVALDKDLSKTPPVCVEANQVPGLFVSEITWNQPLGDMDSFKGYNVYRNGNKINSEIITDTKYYDKDLAAGTYKYTVTAVYEDGESDMSETATIKINARENQNARNLLVRQKGYKSAFAIWNEPSTNYVENNYFSNGEYELDGFGGGDISFESGTLYSAEQMSLYQDYRLVGVSFYPGSPQGSWIINIYRHNDGVLTLVKSIPVTQTLDYGTKNTVKFAQPLAFKAGQDLLIGIQSNVIESSYNVQQIFLGCLKQGYTDLIRKVGEEDFYSINAASQSGAYDFAWGTSAIFAPTNTSTDLDEIDHYNVYIDGQKAAETKGLTFESKDIAAGDHILSLQTVYTDARESKLLSEEFSVSENDKALKITPEVRVNMSDITAQWESPKDNDKTTLGYCSNMPSALCPSTTANVTEIMARVDFTPTELRSYEGYTIESVNFYPLSNSCFEIQIYEGGVDLAVIPVEEFTIGQWNTVKLDEPITIKAGQTYNYVVVAYDCPVGESPLGMDASGGSKTTYSSLIKAGGEDGWYTISDETGNDGNWMMRANIVAPNSDEFTVSNYDIYLDGAKVKTQKDTQFSYSFADTDGTHKIRVDAVYPDLDKTIQGTNVSFKLGTTTAIEDIAINRPTLSDKVIFNISGQRVNNDFKGFKISKGKKYFAR